MCFCIFVISWALEMYGQIHDDVLKCMIAVWWKTTEELHNHDNVMHHHEYGIWCFDWYYDAHRHDIIILPVYPNWIYYLEHLYVTLFDIFVA